MDRVDESYHILAISREGRITSRDGDPWTLKCSDCHMVFGDVTLLKNHKAHFCVGSKLGDPQALQLNKGLLDTGRPPEKLDLPDDDETPRYDSSRDPKMLQLAELHGQQMEFYKHQNEELEKQREEIRRRLEELHHRQPQKDNASEELLKELREEEERSRKMLEELRRQLMEARRPINIISGPEKTPPEPESRTYTYPMIYGSSIVQEILAVKEAYIRNGGSDPEILSQLEELLAEARALEESIKNMPPKQPKQKEDSSQLISVELENKRLLEQLIQLQEQKMLNKQRGCDKDGSDMEHELRRLRRDHQRKMYEMEMQIERMRQDALLDRLLLEIQLRGGGPPTAPGPPTKIVLKQRPQAPAQPATTPQVVQTTETYDVTLPYEEEEGFVIFYDFVLNLEPNIFAMRLLVGLHNMTNKLGEPSVIPMVYTEPTVGPGDPVEGVCNAIIGARQPVKKCPAMSDLGIVVELQVAGAIGSNHDPTRLITRAWTKIPLFDGQSRLYVGRFKLPLRHSPIKPYIPFGELDEVAQYGDSELYYRIVHYRDAVAHSMATISASHRTMYVTAPIPADPPPQDWDDELDEPYFRLPSRPSETQ